RHDQVDLVVAGRGDHHVAPGKVGLLQAGQLARVGEQPLRGRYPFGAQLRGVALDQEYLVAVVGQLLRDGAAHVAGPRDGDAHGQCFPSGAAPVTFVTAATISSVTSMNTWSPSCTAMDGVGRVPMPNRCRNATRAPDASSISRTGRPIQSGWTGTSMMDTVLVGSRNSSTTPSGTRWRSIRSAVHRTVATVGMPSRSYTSARFGS